MNLKTAIGIIEDIHGFDDETSMAGEAWAVVMEGIDKLEKHIKTLETVRYDEEQHRIKVSERMDRLQSEIRTWVYEGDQELFGALEKERDELRKEVEALKRPREESRVR